MVLVSGYQSMVESTPVSDIVHKLYEIQDVLVLLSVLNTSISEDVDESKITFSRKHLQPLIDRKTKDTELRVRKANY